MTAMSASFGIRLGSYAVILTYAVIEIGHDFRRCRPKFAATGSIQTVCQMPVTAVYQMPCGLRDLFAARLRAGIGRVPNANDNSCGPFWFSSLGDIETRKRHIRRDACRLPCR